MADVATYSVVITDPLDTSKPALRPEVSSLIVSDQLGYFQDNISVDWSHPYDLIGPWAVDSVDELPSLLLVDVSMGVNERPMRSFGSYYVHGLVGVHAQDGLDISIACNRLSLGSQLESMLRLQVQHSPYIVGPGIRRVVAEAPDYAGLVSALRDYGYMVTYHPLNERNIGLGYRVAVPVGPGGGTVTLDSLGAWRGVGWDGQPVPFIESIQSITGSTQSPLDTSDDEPLDISDSEVTHTIGDNRVRSTTPPHLNIHAIMKNATSPKSDVVAFSPGGGLLQPIDTSVYVSSIRYRPDSLDSLLPVVTIRQVSDNETLIAARILAEGQWRRYNAEAASVTIPFNPYLPVRRFLRRRGRLYRAITVAHDLGQLNTNITMIPIRS